MERCLSGQKGLTVNQVAPPIVGSNPTRSTGDCDEFWINRHPGSQSPYFDNRV